MRNKLKELRIQSGLTQEELADRVGVSRQTIISIESGKYNPSIMLGYKIARMFGQPIETVFLCAEEMEGERDHE